MNEVPYYLNVEPLNPEIPSSRQIPIDLEHLFLDVFLDTFVRPIRVYDHDPTSNRWRQHPMILTVMVNLKTWLRRLQKPGRSWNICAGDGACDDWWRPWTWQQRRRQQRPRRPRRRRLIQHNDDHDDDDLNYDYNNDHHTIDYDHDVDNREHLRRLPKRWQQTQDDDDDDDDNNNNIDYRIILFWYYRQLTCTINLSINL